MRDVGGHERPIKHFSDQIPIAAIFAWRRGIGAADVAQGWRAATPSPSACDGLGAEW
jgi:hypothetical protein